MSVDNGGNTKIEICFSVNKFNIINILLLL